jgi:hypothetical protein
MRVVARGTSGLPQWTAVVCCRTGRREFFSLVEFAKSKVADKKKSVQFWWGVAERNERLKLDQRVFEGYQPVHRQRRWSDDLATNLLFPCGLLYMCYKIVFNDTWT